MPKFNGNSNVTQLIAKLNLCLLISDVMHFVLLPACKMSTLTNMAGLISRAHSMALE